MIISKKEYENLLHEIDFWKAKNEEKNVRLNELNKKIRVLLDKQRRYKALILCKNTNNLWVENIPANSIQEATEKALTHIEAGIEVESITVTEQKRR